jgi:hypothetical protein
MPPPAAPATPAHQEAEKSTAKETPANSHADEAYEGPAGLKWGQSPGEVRKALSGRFHFVKEDTQKDVTAQSYTGEFSGFKVDTAISFFVASKLAGLTVLLPARDERPASRRWQDMVDAMTKAKGEPTEISSLPSQAKLSDAIKAYPGRSKAQIQQLSALFDAAASKAGMSGYEELDARVRRGEIAPYAQWRFKDDVRVTIALQVSQPDQAGQRRLTPVWAFMTTPGRDAMAAMTKNTDL